METIFQEEEAGRIAHDFFVRGRYQEMLGHQELALQSYLIAFQHDSLSRELCFFIGYKFKMRGEYERAFHFIQKGLRLKGEARFSDFKLTADVLLHLGKIQQAVMFYDSALVFEEDNRDVLYTLAAIYEQEGKQEEQLKTMERLIPLVNFPEGLVDRAVKIYRNKGNIQALVEMYKNAWKATGINLYGEKLASVYASLDLYNHYLDIYRQLFRKNPENYYYKVQIAQAFLATNDLDSAFHYYKEFVQKFPDKEQFLYTFATLLYVKEKYQESKALFLKLLSKNPENPQYHFYLGSIGEFLDDKELAELEFQKALSLDEENINYWSKLSLFFLREGKYNKAIEVLDGMVKHNPKSPQAWYFYGVAFNQWADSLEQQSDFGVINSQKQDKAVKYRKEAIKNFRRSLELNADDKRVLFELGVSLERTNQYSESIRAFKRLIQLDSTNADALNYLGYMLVEQEKDLEVAITLINKALARNPKNGAFLDSKGWWYYKMKNYSKAKEYIEKALESGIEDVVVLEHLALVLEKMGDMDSAREQWTLILKLDPDHKIANERIN